MTCAPFVHNSVSEAVHRRLDPHSMVSQQSIGVAWFIAAFVIGGAASAVAHDPGAAPSKVTWQSWGEEPVVVVGLFLSAALYIAGLRALRSATGAGGKLAREAAYFTAGWLVLVIALVSPLHPWGAELFAAHMVQHELLMVVAAPLVVLGRPGLVWLCALPRSAARQLMRALQHSRLQRLWQWVCGVFIASLVHAFALWLWHVPVLFEATANEWAHMAQHVSFLLSAIVFWQGVFYGRRRAAGFGLSVLFLFFTALHSGALGALLTFATTLWYPSYALTSPAWGLSALEDQQLGGLIMWIPAGVVYVVVAVALFARWLRESDLRRERASTAITVASKCARSALS